MFRTCLHAEHAVESATYRILSPIRPSRRDFHVHSSNVRRRDAKVYCHKTTTMHGMSSRSPPPSRSGCVANVPMIKINTNEHPAPPPLPRSDRFFGHVSGSFISGTRTPHRPMSLTKPSIQHSTPSQERLIKRSCNEVAPPAVSPPLGHRLRWPLFGRPSVEHPLGRSS